MLSIAVINSRFGATAEEEAFFESEAPPFATCADPAYATRLRTTTVDKDDLIGNCIIRAYRSYATNPEAALMVGRQMVTYVKEDPALAPKLDLILRAVMDKYGVATEFINMILAAPAPVKRSKLKTWHWVAGTGFSLAVVGILAATLTINAKKTS